MGKGNLFLFFRKDLLFKLAFLRKVLDSVKLKSWEIGRVNNSVNQMEQTYLPPSLSSHPIHTPGIGQK